MGDITAAVAHLPPVTVDEAVATDISHGKVLPCERLGVEGTGPWAVLDVADGSTVAAMGIQGSDGSRAHAQVRRLRALVDSHTR